MICPVCKKEFEGRADAKFCSDKCRKAMSRINVTDKLSVTSKGTMTEKHMDQFAEAVREQRKNPPVTEAERKYLKRYKLKMKLIQDLKSGVTGEGSLKGDINIPKMTRAKNPWPDLLKTKEDQERLNKVLDNYYG